MDPRHLSLRQLEVLKTVADSGSMAEAGRRLFMTGPAITQQVQQLEKVLGMPVLDRLGLGDGGHGCWLCRRHEPALPRA